MNVQMNNGLRRTASKFYLINHEPYTAEEMVELAARLNPGFALKPRKFYSEAAEILRRHGYKVRNNDKLFKL